MALSRTEPRIVQPCPRCQESNLQLIAVLFFTVVMVTLLLLGNTPRLPWNTAACWAGLSLTANFSSGPFVFHWFSSYLSSTTSGSIGLIHIYITFNSAYVWIWWFKRHLAPPASGFIGLCLINFIKFHWRLTAPTSIISVVQLTFAKFMLKS